MPIPKLSGPAAARIELQKRIGAGCFGEVYRALDLQTNEQVAVKTEELRSGAPQLAWEYDVSKKVLEGMPDPPGFAVPCLFFEQASRSHCALVMPMLGHCLEDMVVACGGKLTAKTTLILADQAIRRLEYLHSLGIVHRDIKPENFMLGRRGPTEHHVYLIDFGLSRAYHDFERHRPIRHKLSLTGTARYASINAHKGTEQSRRDDLEAVGYMLMYFLRGAMPWSGLAARTKQEKFARIAEVKANTDLNELCAGHPDCFKEYVIATRALEYEERPNYTGLRDSFKAAFDAAGYVEDYNYDWYKGSPPDLPPIPAWASPAQPDDPAIKSSPSSAALAGDACDRHNEHVKKKHQEVEFIKKAFNNWDYNHDGGIDQEEFKKVLLGVVSEADVVAMFERADLNHDGQINYEEFMQWIEGDLPAGVEETLYALHGDHEPEKEAAAAAEAAH